MQYSINSAKILQITLLRRCAYEYQKNYSVRSMYSNDSHRFKRMYGQ